MSLLVLLLILAALASALGGVFVSGLKVLLWVALALAALALISWAVPQIRGRHSIRR